MNSSRYSTTLLALLVITASPICHAGKKDQPKRFSPKSILAITALTALGLHYFSQLDGYYYSTAPVHCTDFPGWDERPDHQLIEAEKGKLETDLNTIYCLQRKPTKTNNRKIIAHIVKNPESNAFLYKEIACDDFQQISCDSRSCFAGITDWYQSDDRGVDYSMVCLTLPNDNDPLILQVKRSKSTIDLYDHTHE